jgi:hypothetical protein
MRSDRKRASISVIKENLNHFAAILPKETIKQSMAQKCVKVRSKQSINPHAPNPQ